MRGVGVNLLTNLEEKAEVREEVLEVLRQSPRDFGIERTRWRLKDMLRKGLESIQVSHTSSLWQVLKRLDIRFREGWQHTVSPDPDAKTKLRRIEQVQHQAFQQTERCVAVWLDELTVYRQPSTAPTWSDGRQRPQKARCAADEEKKLRIVGALNIVTGQVSTRYHVKIGKEQLTLFYAQLRDTYPDAEVIYALQDCWPVHEHEDVLQAADRHQVEPVFLPTYSSWRNPIEKLWRWLKQAVVHMHPWANAWDILKQEVRRFLNQFEQPNTRSLQYVGLLN